MKRIFPDSLLSRTLLVLVAALVLSQLAAFWFLHEYVTRPRASAGVGQFVSHLKTIDAALQTMPPAQEQEFIGRIVEREGIRILPTSSMVEPIQPAADIAPIRDLRERIHDLFGPQADVYVRNADLDDGNRPPGRPPLLWVRLPAGETSYWVAFPRGRLERDTTQALVGWGAVGLLIAILATFFIVWTLSRPLSELSRAAEVLGRGQDPAPVRESGPAEIRAVARAFNTMKEDLRKAERDRAAFLAGVSHDLRTPLARLRLEVEMLEGKVDETSCRAMVGDVDEMNAIIDQFIDFMRSEASEPLVAVNLSELARNCAERAARGGVQVSCELDDVPMQMLRPLAAQRMIDNLLANAARHAGGEIQLRTAAQGQTVTLSVLDRGPGIPQALVERLKEPFTRRDEARSGSSGAGLGLAIANRVAAIHGGRLDLLPRAGGGLEARVTLPVA